MLIDPSTPFGARVEQRLRQEEVIWLTTVRPNGTPEPSPVWFLWDGARSVLIYSQPNKPKLRAIAQNPRVALSFNTDAQGGNVVVFTGDAQIDQAAPPATQVADYVTKYASAIRRIGMTPETFAQSYSVPIRVTLRTLRGY